MKNIKKIIIAIFILVGSSLVVLGLTYSFCTSPLSKEQKDIIVDIKKNTTSKEIGRILENKNIIRSKTFFYLYVKLNNINDLKAATYVLSPSMDFKKIISILTKGVGYNKDEIKITFKEGNNIENIAETIEKNTSNNYNDILSVFNDKKYIDTLIDKYWFLTNEIKNNDIYYSLEGYLFPETYNFFSRNVKPQDIIEVMLNQTDKILTKYKKEINASKFTIHKLLTMASIVELEAGASSSYNKDIARVFYNRLDKNMSLGSDVTTYYALKIKLSERDLTSKEFNTFNLYNTRGPKMEGKLPIGPICNASEATIKDIINPPTNDYLFFVADRHGKVFFTKTNAEHLQVVKEIKDRGDWIKW